MKSKIIISFFFFFATCFLVAQNGDESFSVSNGFTPNGDGKNDSLTVTGKGIKKYSVEIYDRWGEKLITLNEKEIKSWDGKIKGKEVSVGVYVWRAEVEFISGKKAEQTGNVTLIR